jgi:hypothetical protein
MGGTINIIASEGLELREVDDVALVGHGIELRKVDSVELVGRGIAGDDSEGPPFPTLSLRSFLPASAASDALRAGKANQAN